MVPLSRVTPVPNMWEKKSPFPIICINKKQKNKDKLTQIFLKSRVERPWYKHNDFCLTLAAAVFILDKK